MKGRGRGELVFERRTETNPRTIRRMQESFETPEVLDLLEEFDFDFSFDGECCPLHSQLTHISLLLLTRPFTSAPQIVAAKNV